MWGNPTLFHRAKYIEKFFWKISVFWQNQSRKDFWLKDTHRGKVPSNKTPALTKSRNMGIWVVGTPNQLFIRDY